MAGEEELLVTPRSSRDTPEPQLETVQMPICRRTGRNTVRGLENLQTEQQKPGAKGPLLCDSVHMQLKSSTTREVRRLLTLRDTATERGHEGGPRHPGNVLFLHLGAGCMDGLSV